MFERLKWLLPAFAPVTPGASPEIAIPAVVETESRALIPAENTTERRDYTLKSQDAIRLLVFGTPSLSGVAVNNDTLLSTTPAWRALSLIGNGIAMLDRKVKKKKKKGVRDLDEHPIALLMAGRPHAHYTWFDMLFAWVVNAGLGNGYILIHWDYEIMRPWALEHIPQSMVWIEYDLAGNLWYRISGEINGRQVSRLVPSTDILHLKGLTTNAINGRQVALVHRPTFGSGIAAKQYTESIFGKGAHPSIAVKYSEPMTSTERKNAKTNFMAEQSGSDKAGEPLILDDGMDVKYLQWSPQDVALVDFSELNAEDCCRIWGIPREYMAIDSKGTYGAVSQKAQDLLTHCYSPWMEKIQEEINTKLFWNSEIGNTYFEFDASMYMAMDKETEAKTLALLVAGKLMTPNEGRLKLGLKPMPGGDVLFGDINSLPLDSLVQVALAKYLSSAGEQLQGQKPTNQTNLPANNQKDTAHAPAGQ